MSRRVPARGLYSVPGLEPELDNCCTLGVRAVPGRPGGHLQVSKLRHQQGDDGARRSHRGVSEGQRDQEAAQTRAGGDGLPWSCVTCMDV